jgi:manganese/iron transport system substrate-binding protein
MNVAPNKKSWKSRSSRFLAVALIACLAACNQTPPEEKVKVKPSPRNDKLQVVATTALLCELVKTIAAESIDLQCLLTNDKDADTYAPTASDKEAFDRANIVFYSGHGFEAKMIPAIKDSMADKKIAVAELAVTNPEKKDGKINPFVWHNAYKTIELAKIIHQKLGDALPKNAATYEKNYDAFDKVNTALHEWLKVQIASIPPLNRQLVSSRNSLTYYSNPYNIAVEGSVYDFTTTEKPTAERIAKVVKRIKELKIKAVFNEVGVDGVAIGKVASQTKVPVAKGELFIDGVGNSGAETYQKMMLHNTKIIVEGLGGTYKAFQPPKIEKDKKDKDKDK